MNASSRSRLADVDLVIQEAASSTRHRCVRVVPAAVHREPTRIRPSEAVAERILWGGLLAVLASLVLGVVLLGIDGLKRFTALSVPLHRASAATVVPPTDEPGLPLDTTSELLTDIVRRSLAETTDGSIMY